MNLSVMPISRSAESREHVFASTVKSQLQGQYLGGLVRLGDQTSRMALLQTGRMLIRRDNSEVEVMAPAFIWRPPECADERFYLCAGSTCEQVILDDIALTNAIGHNPEAVALRVFSVQAGIHSLDNAVDLHGDLARCIKAISLEFASKRPGWETIIEAQIRVMLVLLWREFHVGDTDRPAVATRALILLRFRQSVEAHFRDRWTVTQHAASLNVSVDRLHAICTDTLGKSPQQLIHQRLAHEARLLLERSEMTLDQLSVYLGFKNSPQFNVFCKLHHGVPPGQYRRSFRQDSSVEGVVSRASYADWP